MQIKRIALVGIMAVIMLSGCGTTVQKSVIREEKTQETESTEKESVTDKDTNMNEKESFNAESNINDVIHDSAFDGYGRLIFPVDMEIEDNLKLKNISSILPWYSEVNIDKTVEIVNYMKSQAMNGEQIFYPIYSEEEMQEDPDKGDTGLFFSGEMQEQKQRLPMREEALYMWLEYMTVFLMRWNCQRKGTMHLPLSIAPEHRLPAKILPGQLRIYMKMQRNYR